jgi:hypothetical protein
LGALVYAQARAKRPRNVSMPIMQSCKDYDPHGRNSFDENPGAPLARANSLPLVTANASVQTLAVSLDLH